MEKQFYQKETAQVIILGGDGIGKKENDNS